MALPNAVNGGVVTSIPSGSILVIHAPAATVSGWQDYYITAVNFLKSVTDDITAIELDITNIQLDITALQDLGQLDQSITGLNSNTTKVFASNSLIEWIGIRVTSGTPTIKIGTSAGGEQVLPETAYTGRNIIRVDYDTGGSSLTLYITVSGGTVNMSFKITKNILI